MRYSTIGGEHELFNDAMSDIALAAGDVGHALLIVEFDNRFGQIEIDGTVFVAAGVEQKREALHGAEMVIERGVARGHFRIAFEHFVDVGIGHALGRTNDALHHPGIEQAVKRVCALSLSVRQTENLVQSILFPDMGQKDAKPEPVIDPNVKEVAERLQRALGLRVRIEDKQGRGRVIIEYGKLEEFDALLEQLAGTA